MERRFPFKLDELRTEHVTAAFQHLDNGLINLGLQLWYSLHLDVRPGATAAVDIEPKLKRLIQWEYQKQACRLTIPQNCDQTNTVVEGKLASFRSASFGPARRWAPQRLQVSSPILA